MPTWAPALADVDKVYITYYPDHAVPGSVDAVRKLTELAKEAGAPVKLELSRKEDFIGMHGRWPTVQYYKVGVSRDGVLKAIQLRGYSGMGPYRKNSGAIV